MSGARPATLPRVSPVRATTFALLLLSLGFAIGYGFHTAQSVTPSDSSTNNAGSSPSPQATPTPLAPPVVKGLRVSPDGRHVAFTGVYGDGQRAARFVLDLQTGKADIRQAPRGWQDFIVQWSDDGHKLLFDRERIPRAVAEATAGLHEERIAEAHGQIKPTEPRSLTSGGVLPDGEKSFSGFWTSQNELVVKTKREPKSLYIVRNGRATLLDRANGSYLQNRAVREQGRTVYYVVRDVPSQAEGSALFRIVDNKPRQISPVFKDVTWAYIADNARFMVVCREGADSWEWTLYRVTPNGVSPLKTRDVPSDVISVFWSPDFRQILGASGQSLWTVQIPSLQSRRIGNRSDWNADDAGWLPRQNAVLVAAGGTLWKVDIATGNYRPIWKFPRSYWGNP